MGEAQEPAQAPGSADIRRRIAQLKARLAELDGYTIPEDLTAALLATSPSRWSLAWIRVRARAPKALIMLRGDSIDAKPAEVLAYLERATATPPIPGPGPFARDSMPQPLEAAVVDLDGQPHTVLSHRLCGPELRAAARTIRMAYKAGPTGRRLFALTLPALGLLREAAAWSSRWAGAGSSAAAGAVGGVVTIATAAAITVHTGPPPQLVIRPDQQRIYAEQTMPVGVPAASTGKPRPATSATPSEQIPPATAQPEVPEQPTPSPVPPATAQPDPVTQTPPGTPSPMPATPTAEPSSSATPSPEAEPPAALIAPSPSPSASPPAHPHASPRHRWPPSAARWHARPPRR